MGSEEARLRDLPIWPEQVVGTKHIRSLERLIEGLRPETPHGNRELFLDDVFVAYLLAFFNPALRTLRTIEDFSQTRQAQRHLTIRKLCKSTFSDFNKLADPTLLQPILDHLRREVLRPGPAQAAEPLVALHRRVLAVDGTFLKAAAKRPPLSFGRSAVEGVKPAHDSTFISTSRPGCRNCWSSPMTARARRRPLKIRSRPGPFISTIGASSASI